MRARGHKVEGSHREAGYPTQDEEGLILYFYEDNSSILPDGALDHISLIESVYGM